MKREFGLRVTFQRVWFGLKGMFNIGKGAGLGVWLLILASGGAPLRSVVPSFPTWSVFPYSWAFESLGVLLIVRGVLYGFLAGWKHQQFWEEATVFWQRAANGELGEIPENETEGLRFLEQVPHLPVYTGLMSNTLSSYTLDERRSGYTLLYNTVLPYSSLEEARAEWVMIAADYLWLLADRQTGGFIYSEEQWALSYPRFFYSYGTWIERAFCHISLAIWQDGKNVHLRLHSATMGFGRPPGAGEGLTWLFFPITFLHWFFSRWGDYWENPNRARGTFYGLQSRLLMYWCPCDAQQWSNQITALNNNVRLILQEVLGGRAHL
jgi:hypothetical protein